MALLVKNAKYIGLCSNYEGILDLFLKFLKHQLVISNSDPVHRPGFNIVYDLFVGLELFG